MQNRRSVYFDRTGFAITVASVVAGALLTVGIVLLTYHLAYIRPHTMPVNPQSRGISVGFVLIPADMDAYRGLVSFSAEYGPSEVWAPEFLLPPIVWPGGLRTKLIYWSKDGSQKVVQSSFFIACDPDRVYYPVGGVREVVLYQLNDLGEMFPLASVPVQNGLPRPVPIIMPKLKMHEEPSPPPSRGRQGAPHPA